jgi:hypothetical protein
LTIGDSFGRRQRELNYGSDAKFSEVGMIDDSIPLKLIL